MSVVSRSIQKTGFALAIGAVATVSIAVSAPAQADRPPVQAISSMHGYSFKGFESRKEYEREMMLRCGSVTEVGESPVFGPVEEYRDNYMALGKLSAEIDATVHVSRSGRASVNAMHTKVKDEIDTAIKHITYSYNAEKMAEKQIAYKDEVVPENSRIGNRIYRQEEQDIINHQRREGLSQATSLLSRTGDLPYLEQCQEWWAYQQSNPKFPKSKWFGG